MLQEAVKLSQNSYARYSANMVRKRIFDARLKVKKAEKEKGKTVFEIEPGVVTCEINGILDQTDMNILIALEAVKKRKIEKDGAISFLFSQRSLLKMLGMTATHHAWLKEKLTYLQTRQVFIRVTREDKDIVINTNIIRKWGYVDVKNIEDGRGKNVFGGNRLFFVTIEAEFATLLFKNKKDIHIYIPVQELKKIYAIKDGYTQMIIKYILTQKADYNYKIALEKALAKIGVENTGTSKYRQIKRRVKENINKAGTQFNIKLLDRDIIVYKRCKYVLQKHYKFLEKEV